MRHCNCAFWACFDNCRRRMVLVVVVVILQCWDWTPGTSHTLGKCYTWVTPPVPRVVFWLLKYPCSWEGLESLWIELETWANASPLAKFHREVLSNVIRFSNSVWAPGGTAIGLECRCCRDHTVVSVLNTSLSILLWGGLKLWSQG
jgi:hypothetical protein